MQRHLNAIATAVLCLVVCRSAIAAHPLVTDDTATQGLGNHQLEFNTDQLRDSDFRTRVGAFTYSYGLQPNLDVFVNVPISISTPRGIGDLSLGAKWRFWEQQSSSIGLKPELLLPSGDVERELGTGRAGMAVTLLASHVFTPWTLHANVGFTMNRYKDSVSDDASRRTVWRLSAAASYAVNDTTAIVFDLGAGRNPERAVRANPAFALVGLIYTPYPEIDIDVGLKFGLNRAEVHRQLGAGLTLRF